MRALIITKTSDNESVDYVTRALERRGARPFRFDTDRFPTEVRVAVRLDGDRVEARITDRTDTVLASELAGAWYRRTEIGGRIPRTIDRNLRAPSLEESRRVFLGLVEGLPCRVVDRPAVLRYAEQKLLQLEAAKEAGLEIPRTLVTNDAERVRAFWDECQGRVVAKMMTGFAVVEEGQEKVVFTSPLAEADLGELERLALCPMTFQETVEKARELRITIVGERVFAAAIDPAKLERSKTDWRREGLALISDWEVCDLPADLEKGLLRVMDAFGLNYGAIDVIVTPEGRHVFLEVNPAGEFFWLERENGLPISEAIADVMLGLAPGRDGSRPRPATRRSSPSGTS